MNLTDLPANMQSKIALELPLVSDVDGMCWGWQNCLQSQGYGCVQHDGRRQSTHRVAYTLLVGPIPDGLQIDHLCLNRRCCNPAHLEPVTAAVNIRRTDAAHKPMCVHGHPMVGDNVLIKKRGNRSPVRNCRTCRDERQAARRAAVA